MPLPAKPFFTLPEIAKRWGVSVRDLGCYALEEVLTLSTVVNGVDAEVGAYVEDAEGGSLRLPQGRQTLAGVQDLYGFDVWPVFKGGTTMILRFKPADPLGFLDIEEPADGIEIGLDDLIVTRAERDRFEAEHSLARPERTRRTAKAAGGPGASPRHDWDGFWIRICQQINDLGRPATQAAMVRELLDWFGETHGAVPDESTVKKKVSRFWHEFEVR